MKQNEVVALYHTLQQVPLYILDAKDTSVRFRYGFTKNIKSLRAEVDIITEVYEDKLKPIVDAFRAKDPGGENKPLSGVTVCGLLHIPLSLEQKEVYELMEEILKKEENKEIMDFVNKDMAKSDSDWQPYKVALVEVPAGFTTAMIDQMDIIIKE